MGVGDTDRKSILLIEDNEDYSNYIVFLLKKSDHPYKVIKVHSLRDAAKELSSTNFDIILSDLRLPDSTGIKTFEMLKSLSNQIPIIVLTNIDDYKLGLELVRAGAADYIPKKDIQGSLLTRMIMYTIEKMNSERETLLSLSTMYQVQKNESLGRMMFSLTHEFNNIFTLICGYSEYLSTLDLKPDMVKDAIAEIQKAGDRGKNIVKNIIQLSSKQHIFNDLVSVKRLISYLHDEVKDVVGVNTELIIDVDENFPVIRMDQENLHQILLNLVLNASEAIEYSGTIRLSASVSENQESVVFRIIDNGKGISEDNKSKLFEKGFSTKPNGTGMGLYMTKSILKRYGGSIVIDSEAEVGTEVRITLPIENRFKELDTFVEMADDKKYVILIDDDPDVINMLSMVLRSAGFYVDAFGDAKVVLKSLANNPRKPDLVISDLLIAGMNGLELYDKSRELGQFGFLFITGHYQYFKAKLSKYKVPVMKKPFSVKAFVKKVEALTSSTTVNKP